jgi:septum formation protein
VEASYSRLARVWDQASPVLRGLCSYSRLNRVSAPPRLILASRSPQRGAILERLGISFEVRAADIEELDSGPPDAVALNNARRKASAVAALGDGGQLVLGVDTVVALGDRLHGKPSDAADARETLEALSGRTHAVIGGLCLIGPAGTRTAVVTTDVEFRFLDDWMIDWYLNTGEWRERAGGYAIQGKGAALVARIDGDYLNVVGLPLAALLELEPGLIGS